MDSGSSPDYGWDSFNPPKPPPTTPAAMSGPHFQFHRDTQWYFPIVIDTVALEEDTIAVGDEIGVFTSAGLCVGSKLFGGSFPIVLNAWEDDICTPEVIDGYLDGEEMTFVLWDASENQEITFVLPPMTEAAMDEPVGPSYAGFGQGLYAYRSLDYGVQSVTQLPKEYKVGQNYPNPFNAETVIPLELPERSLVSMVLFNIRGERVAQIQDAIKEAGWERIRFNAAHLASGIYFYQLTAEGLERGGTFTHVDKMLVLK